MIRVLSAAAIIALGFTVALAQDSPLDQRKAAMKAMSKAGKAPGLMLKGEAPFDLAAVKAALTTFAAESKKSKGLYPAGSDQGETRAKPEVWSNSADFMGRFDKLAADAEKASASITDEASFKTEYKQVASNCGGCHKIYRAEKK